ncbi:MAG: aldo/keto reductase [Solirubrobacteraceae bacterium]|nr:aldo/keto reductase [Solirubrobacteraceae bacterium]
MPTIPHTDLDVSPLCLGGNVFGWTADATQSHAVLDTYADAGGNFIDTADVYSQWVPGNDGGESETIIGDWLAGRADRDRFVIATKVGELHGLHGLSASTVRTAVEGSLRRLRTDHIDLYWAHIDDHATPLTETLGVFHDLITEGKVRYIGASNISGLRLAEALEAADRHQLTRYVAVQPHYNLLERDFERRDRDIVARERLATIPYYGLASGFLTGKYRPGARPGESARGGGAAKHLEDDRAVKVLGALDDIAAGHGTAVAAVALAWLGAQPTVCSPIASARTVEQLTALLPMQDLRLTGEDIARLDGISS